MATLTSSDLDNGKIDIDNWSDVVNSTTKSTITTRLGDTVKTRHGLTADFDAAIAAAGANSVGNYGDNPTLTNVNDVAWYATGSVYYKLKSGVSRPYTINSTTYADPSDDPNLQAYTETFRVSSIAELQGKPVSDGLPVYLSLGIQSDWFEYDVSDLSAEVANETAAGVSNAWYVPQGGDDGSSGAWVRVASKTDINTNQFGGGELGFKAACQFLQDHSGGSVTVLDESTVNLTSQIDIDAWTKHFTLKGVGTNSTEVKANADDISIFSGTAAAEINFTVRDITLRGYWADNNKQADGDTWLINLFNIATYYQTHCKFVSSQRGLVKIKATVKSESTFCEGHEASRGGFNFAGSPIINVFGCDFLHLGDDAVSAHVPSNPTFATRPTSIHIDGNTFRDCQGIVALAARKTTITNNNGKLIRGRFIYCGYDTTFGEGFASSSGVQISNNVCEDVLNAGAYDDGDSNFGYYVWVRPYQASTGGGQIDSNPGTAYTSTPSITPLYGNMNGLGDRSSNIIAGMWNVVMSNNILVRTEAGDVDYTSYGQVDDYTPDGYYFTMEGYATSTIDESEFNNDGYLVSSGVSNFAILGGVIQTSSRAIYFQYDDNDPTFTNGYVGGGLIVNDCSSSDAFVTNSNSSRYPAKFDVTFDDILLDLDPYFNSSIRTTPIDGTWTGSSLCRVFNIAYTVGARIGNISIKNASKLGNFTGGETPTLISYIGKITYRCDPVGWDDNASNKGIRNIDRPSDVNQYEIYDADPSSSTYGLLERSAVSVETNTMPTSGTYVQGEYVRNSNRSVDGNSMITLGWQRLTTGSAHVVDTDWAVIYGSTVSPAS